MKTRSFINLRTGILLLGFSAMATISSCKKEDSTSGNSEVSEQVVADAVIQSVTPQSDGMIDQVTTASARAQYTPACGTSFDSAIVKASGAGSAISFSSSLKWNWMLTCGSTPSFTFSFAGKINYDGPRISSSDSSTGSFTVTGLTASSTSYNINQNYTRTGSQVSKLNNTTFNSTIKINSADIVIDKSSQIITSGTAIVNVSGTTSTGKSFNYNGTLTFTGNKSATFAVTGGASYQFSW